MMVPEFDSSQVSEFVAVEKAEIIPGASGTQAQLSLVLNVLKDFGGKRLVLDTYDSKSPDVGYLGAIPLPDPVGGKIACTVQALERWQTRGKGVFRLVEPTR